MKILIVDDSRAMRMIVRRTLRQAGYGAHPTTEAENGVEAMAQIKADKPDLILSDWNMPEMDGLQLLEAINADAIDVPFGFITSQYTPEMKEKAITAGARFLLAKPFTVESFQEALKVVVR